MALQPRTAVAWNALQDAKATAGVAVINVCTAVSRKRKTILWPTLQSKLPTNVAVAVSVPYTKEGVANLLKTIKPFIQACELKEGLSVEIALEELPHEVIEADSKHKPNETFDLRIVDTVDKFTIVVKSKEHR